MANAHDDQAAQPAVLDGEAGATDQPMSAPPDHSNDFHEKVMPSFMARYEALVATLQIAKKRMERWNIGRNLPKMYLPLGKDIYSTGRFRSEFPEVYSALDDHQKELEALERGEVSLPDGDQSEAAKRIETIARSISRKMNTEYGRLGQLAWKKHGEACGPAELNAPIREACQRQETLTAEIVESTVASRRYQRPRPEVDRRDRDDNLNLTLGLIGSGVLAVSVFCPVIKVPIIGGITYFTVDQRGGVGVIILALISFTFVLAKYYRGLWFIGIALLVWLMYVFFSIQLMLEDEQFVSIEFGFPVMIIGAGLIIAAAAIKPKLLDRRS